VEDDDSAVLVRSDREESVIKLSDPEKDGSLKAKDMQKATQLQPHEHVYQLDMERIKALVPSKTPETKSTNPH
jgi:hypothetical protein